MTKIIKTFFKKNLKKSPPIFTLSLEFINVNDQDLGMEYICSVA